jgi:hypothetical protein
MYAYIYKTTQRIMIRVFLIDKEIHENDLYVYNVHKMEEKHPCEAGACR